MCEVVFGVATIFLCGVIGVWVLGFDENPCFKGKR